MSSEVINFRAEQVKHTLIRRRSEPFGIHDLAGPFTATPHRLLRFVLHERQLEYVLCLGQRPISSSFLRMLCTHRMTIARRAAGGAQHWLPRIGSLRQTRNSMRGHDTFTTAYGCFLSLSIVPNLRRTRVVMWLGAAFWLHGWAVFCLFHDVSFVPASDSISRRPRASVVLAACDGLPPRAHRRGSRPSRREICCLHSVPVVGGLGTACFVPRLRSYGVLEMQGWSGEDLPRDLMAICRVASGF